MNSSFFLPKAEGESDLHRTTMRTNVECMLDIETLGTGPTSPIISIGAVLFDPRGSDTFETMEQRALLIRVAIADAALYGDVDPRTLEWWFTQDDAAIKALVGEDAVSLKTALMRFRQYCEVRGNPTVSREFFAGHLDLPQACTIWAKSPDFDCKIMEYGCRRTDEWMPVGYHQYRCVRTLQDLAWSDPEDIPNFQGTQHDASHDAINQALVVQAGYARLGLTGPVKFDTF